MVPLLLLVMLAACAAVPQDLSGQMLTFPEKTNTTYVKLKADVLNLNALTVCLRFTSDLYRVYSLFSLASPNVSNAFQIRKDAAIDTIYVFVDNKVVKFRGLGYMMNKWHSVCCTWDDDSGLVQLWFDGMSTVRKFVGGSAISNPLIVLGQDQDNLGGGFDSKQSFVGMLSEVHMWSYPLTSCEIQNYVDNLNFSPGNVVNWKALTFKTTGRVLVEDKVMSCY